MDTEAAPDAGTQTRVYERPQRSQLPPKQGTTLAKVNFTIMEVKLDFRFKRWGRHLFEAVTSMFEILMKLK